MLHLTITRHRRRDDPRPAFLVRAYASHRLLVAYTTPHRRSALQEARRSLVAARTILTLRRAYHRHWCLRHRPPVADLTPERSHLLRRALAMVD